jgi:hypothetical protein
MIAFIRDPDSIGARDSKGSDLSRRSVYEGGLPTSPQIVTKLTVAAQFVIHTRFTRFIFYFLLIPKLFRFLLLRDLHIAPS